MSKKTETTDYKIGSVLSEIIRPKFPIIFLLVVLCFAFFLLGFLTFFTAIFFIVIFTVVLLAMSSDDREALEFYKNQEESKSKDISEGLNKLKTIIEAIKEPTILINENDVISISAQTINLNGATIVDAIGGGNAVRTISAAQGTACLLYTSDAADE